MDLILLVLLFITLITSITVDIFLFIFSKENNREIHEINKKMHKCPNHYKVIN